ncbi:MAG: hypothetical protein ISP91_01360 [Pseudomonadales bacterium]|jgi:hypothetical protein|nr:hypothetical protein [Pseudomonadales bacterium]
MRILALGILLSFSALTIAGEHVMSDGQVLKTDNESAAAHICLAALESREAIYAKAKELGVKRRDVSKVHCNDMSVFDFARHYREDIRDWSIATVQ